MNTISIDQSTNRASDKGVDKLFIRDGNMNLLQNYRGEKRINQPVLLEAIKFLLVVAFWVGASFGAGLVAPLAAVTLTPILLKPFGLPQFILDFAAATAPLAAVLTFVPVNAMFLVLLERKLLALLTTRLGPNRVGPNGLLQTFADALKLLFKEDIVPAKADKVLFFLAPALFFMPSVIVFMPILSVASNGVGPFAATAFPSSLLFVMAVSSLGIMGLVMAGWASNNKYSLLGGLRSTAQAISYELPLILCIVSLVLLVGSLDLREIANAQANGIWTWNVFAAGDLGNPANYQSPLKATFLFIQFLLSPLLLFIIYFCSLAEVNRTPFDLPEAESELVSGFNTEFSGMKFALFFLAEYTNLFIASAILAILFLGGQYFGIPAIDTFFSSILTATPIGNLSWLFGCFILLMKVYLLIALAIWIRATLPRFRADQLMSLAWKVLIPISLVSILVAAICKVFV
jgi:NADH-quinone oxidoreductase subunit H